jgi:hypothetical protein
MTAPDDHHRVAIIARLSRQAAFAASLSGRGVRNQYGGFDGGFDHVAHV